MNISPHQPRHSSQAPDIATAERPNVAAKSPKTAAPATDTVTLSTGFQTGRDNIHSIGVLALGGEDQFQAWSEKGLEISDDTIEKAYVSWNQGFKDAMQNQGRSSLAMNRYDIVASSQLVPDWFLQERSLHLEAITDADLRASFESGDFYHITGASTGPNARLLNIYNEIAQN